MAEWPVVCGGDGDPGTPAAAPDRAGEQDGKARSHDRNTTTWVACGTDRRIKVPTWWSTTLGKRGARASWASYAHSAACGGCANSATGRPGSPCGTSTVPAPRRPARAYDRLVPNNLAPALCCAGSTVDVITTPRSNGRRQDEELKVLTGPCEGSRHDRDDLVCPVGRSADHGSEPLAT